MNLPEIGFGGWAYVRKIHLYTTEGEIVAITASQLSETTFVTKYIPLHESLDSRDSHEPPPIPRVHINPLKSRQVYLPKWKHKAQCSFKIVFAIKMFWTHTQGRVTFVSNIRRDYFKSNKIQRNSLRFGTTSYFEVCETAQRFFRGLLWVVLLYK